MAPPARKIDVVIPTVGRESLGRLLAALAPQRRPLGRILVIDDRRRPSAPLALPPFAECIRSGGRGPAAARNAGWRAASGEWVAFLDDDVLPDRDWAETLPQDLDDVAPAVAASQGRLHVPLPKGRRSTDWERNVAGLERGAWIGADLALRRAALASVGGFDERFSGAFREDTDLAMRLLRGGWQIVAGERECAHPVPPAGFWISVTRQRGNADDVLMRALHGRHWRHWGRAPRGRLRRHLLTAASLAVAAAAGRARRRRLAAAAASCWLALSGELAVARIAPGPRDRP
ncbi:MAG TPA: glycosyltransferase, partial [Actinomycetota bacterium]